MFKCDQKQRKLEGMQEKEPYVDTLLGITVGIRTVTLGTDFSIYTKFMKDANILAYWTEFSAIFTSAGNLILHTLIQSVGQIKIE